MNASKCTQIHAEGMELNRTLTTIKPNNTRGGEGVWEPSHSHFDLLPKRLRGHPHALAALAP